MIAGKVEAGIRDRLRQNGLAVTWQSSSWDPWRGQHFTGLRLQQLGAAQLPIAELGQLNITLPFVGNLQDAAGHTDDYHGRYLQGLLTLESLKGSADLLELSKDVPVLTARLPETIGFKAFPQLEVRNLRRQTRAGESGVKRSGKGEFDANFTTHPDFIDVTYFEARGGSSLTVSAVGKIDLRKQRVQGRARGKLIGLPGLVTSPLSHLLEIEISGPYDDIRVKPIGPAKLASNTVNGTVGTSIDTLEETGKITGTVLKEGIKLPFKWMGKGPE